MPVATDKIEKVMAWRQKWLAARPYATYPLLAEVRESAMRNFCRLGLPTRRWENWKYARIPAVDVLVGAEEDAGKLPAFSTLSTPSTLSALSTLSTLDANGSTGEIQGSTVAAPEYLFHHHLRFFNGRLLDTDPTAQELIAQGILQALPLTNPPAEESPWHQALSSLLSAESDNPLFYLQVAMLERSYLIQIPSSWTQHKLTLEHLPSTEAEMGLDTGLESRLESRLESGSGSGSGPASVSPSGSGSGAEFCAPSHFIQVSDGAKVTIEERYSQSLAGTWANPVTRLRVGKGATLKHQIAFHQLANFWTAADHAYEVKDEGQLEIYVSQLACRNVRHDVHIALNGEEARAALFGLFLAGAQQYVDNATVIQHNAPRTQSHQYYKGILGREGRGAFTGKIHVIQAAVGSQASQLNKNLLVGDHAQMNTRPQLAIETDDIKCKHGATIGQLNPLETFYLQSRGLKADVAQSILSQAFADEIIMSFPDPAARQSLRQASKFQLESMLSDSQTRLHQNQAAPLAASPRRGQKDELQHSKRDGAQP